VWTEVSHFYIQKWEIILRRIGFAWWSWGKAWLTTCRLSQLALWIGLTRRLGEKLTQMRSELDQLGPHLVPPLLVSGRVTDITCFCRFPITFSRPTLVLKPPFCISNRLEQATPDYDQSCLSGFCVSRPSIYTFVPHPIFVSKLPSRSERPALKT
jgi:hypothetical protein